MKSETLTLAIRAVSNFNGIAFPEAMFPLYRASNKSINLTGNSRVLKRWAACRPAGYFTVSPTWYKKMTLCVAWKFKDRIFLSSDSCVTIGKFRMPYSGIKILEIPIIIRSANDHKTGNSREIFNKTFGFSFTGSYLNAFLLKEIISESLRNLQTAKNEVVSFHRIANFIFHFYENFFIKLQKELKGEDIDFIISGYCPFDNKHVAYKFYINILNEKASFKEILTSTEELCWESMGSGDDEFDKQMILFADNYPDKLSLAVFKCLKYIISNKEFPGVDGTVQHGEFDKDDNFHLVGIHDWDKNTKQPRFFIRGTDIESIKFPKNNDGFYVSYSYLMPFEEEITSEFNKKYKGFQVTTPHSGEE